jgi:geranylgeranyl diphosphate synthase, type I
LFEQFARRYANELDTAMRRIVDTISDDVPELRVMVRYPLGWVDEHNQPYSGSTGKRIRPLFLLLCNEAAGGDWREALYAAAAVELLHNFSLIHDDIQDNSPTRHNRPAVWKVWGQANAINAGDLLFALSYSALHRLTSSHLSSAVILKIWQIFNQTNLELTRGQHLDMSFEQREKVSVDEYISMITGKSAALLAACAQIGSLIATADEAVADKYAEFALNLGIAFQIRDDILGIWGDPSVTGKSVATDILSKKKSLPVLYGLDKSQKLADIYRREPLREMDVEEAVGELQILGAKDYTRSIEAEYYQRAIEALQQADPQGHAADWLYQFVDTLFNRSY